jgi:ABC-type transport system substrate-binding protein
VSTERDDRPLFERRLSRRQFIGGSFSALTLAGLLAACGGEEEAAAPAPAPATTGAATTEASATTEAPATTAAEGEPVAGGRLKIAFGQDIVNIGTADWGFTGFTIGYASFNRLTRLSQDAKTIEPELCEELPELSSDGATYTFKLRQGVTFWDGTEMTADDVKFSLERAMDNNGPGQAQSLYGPLGITGTADFQAGKAKEIVGLKVVDPYTLEMHLDAPNSAVPYTLTMTMAGIVPKAYVEQVGTKEFEQKPMGSGPYQITSYEPGKSLVMDRYSGYWDSAGAGYVDGIDWELNIDPELATLRILNGEADFTHSQVPTGELNKLRDDPTQQDNFKIGDYNNVFYVAGNISHPAIKELKVRQAIAYAVDKEKLVRQLAGIGQPATGGIFSPLSPYYQEGLAYPYDPEQAKALLAEAGFPDGFDIELLIRSDEPLKTTGQALQQDLTAIGINIDAKVLPQGPWLDEAFKYGPILVIGQWELPYPHGSYVVDSAFTQASIDSGCCNFAGWTDPAFEDLVVQAHQTFDDAELVSLYQQMDTIVTKDEALWVPLFYPQYPVLKSARVQGYEVPGTPAADTLYFANYWIDEG